MVNRVEFISKYYQVSYLLPPLVKDYNNKKLETAEIVIFELKIVYVVINGLKAVLLCCAF